MKSTLILRDKSAPEVRVLEVDGPSGAAKVNHCPRTFQGTLSFEQYSALPEHSKQITPSPEMLDFEIACRIVRILQNARNNRSISLTQIDEVLQRMAVLYPHCVELAEEMNCIRRTA